MAKISDHDREFLTTEAMANLLSLTRSGLMQLKAKSLVEGIHYTKLSPGPTGRLMWRREVMLNWVATRHDPAAHERFCADYLQSLDRYSPPRQRAS